MKNEMPLPSAEMVKTPAGRAYLVKLRETKYKYDFLKPSDPMFDKVYGDKIRRQERERAKLESESKSLWAENKDKREFKKRKESGHLLIRS